MTLQRHRQMSSRTIAQCLLSYFSIQFLFAVTVFAHERVKPYFSKFYPDQAKLFETAHANFLKRDFLFNAQAKIFFLLQIRNQRFYIFSQFFWTLNFRQNKVPVFQLVDADKMTKSRNLRTALFAPWSMRAGTTFFGFNCSQFLKICVVLVRCRSSSRNFKASIRFDNPRFEIQAGNF